MNIIPKIITTILMSTLLTNLPYSETELKYNLSAYLNKEQIPHKKDNLITPEQTKAQVELFKQALDEFGATSPEQVISIWAKSEKTRNGVYHYSVSCKDLKANIIKDLGVPKDNYWIYGVSSPWLDRYDVISKNKISDTEYIVKLKFFWSTSSGPFNTTENTLRIIQTGDIWCVKEVT
ncbi:hypothetical protein [Clostridium folliculivorans]|uniref:Uncharacterized protein n=1 Tax=Clostridium folliculivorans TaxID=2886038 RepID=A0A9W5Y386_9CLOT|nr:hypothetical protein [Clostridium folliculivorans]GKU25774.1 hypothetical protein CFOLD11_26000 [Clostridium folliculivorans]GKU28795.1 hypothetical protein CFB3_09010 [Clostridium folliculivorans]